MLEQLRELKEEKAIRRLLRRRQSEDYFTGSGWTKDPNQARSFANSLEAAQACLRHGLVDMEMVLRVAGGSSDLFCTELWPTPWRQINLARAVR